MRRLIPLMTICILLGCAGLAAWDWPLAAPRVQVDFAAASNGGFLTGLLLKSEQPAVMAVQDGELVLSAQEERGGRQRFPVSFGGTLVMEHANGIRSVYSGFPSGNGARGQSSGEAVGWKLAKGAVLGQLPSAEGAEVGALFFRLIDNAFGNAINPQVVLPGLADERVPVITAVQIEPLEAGVRVNISDRMELPQAGFRLFVQLHDNSGSRAAGANRSGAVASLPQEIKVIWNGELAYESNKLALRPLGAEGRLRLIRNRNGTYQELFQADGFVYMGEFKLVEGANRLEIRATDLGGNRTSASYRLFHTARQP
jgi:hypothetical protein